MSLVLIKPPDTEPLLLSEAKAHLRVDVNDDDALIKALIQAAREHVEDKTHRALLPQTWRLTRDSFPARTTMSLEASDVASIETFTYVDIGGVTTDFTAYALDTDAMPARVSLPYGASWPATRAQRNAVTVTFQRSMADDAGALPEVFKTAMKLLIGTWYESREAFVDARFALEVPFSVDALLAPYRRPAMEMA